MKKVVLTLFFIQIFTGVLSCLFGVQKSKYSLDLTTLCIKPKMILFVTMIRLKCIGIFDVLFTDNSTKQESK